MYYLLGWLAFVALVYIYAWLDHAFYSWDVPARMRYIYKELFEES